MTKAIRGIYAAAISPFDAAGKLDAAKLAEYCKYLITDGGCDGVAPTGTTGEGTSIPLAEKLAVPEAFAQAGIEPRRVILGTGCPAVGDTIRLTANAVAAGFNNVLVLPPYYYKSVSDDGLYDYFARVVDGVGDYRLRMYLYHFPQVSMTPLSPELVMRLRRDFGPVVAGLKDSSGDFAQSRAMAEATGGIGNDFDIYPSSEAMYFDALDAGCAGIISGSTNVFANLVQKARESGDPDGAAIKSVKAARAFASGFNLMAAMKLAEAERSGDQYWLRLAPPLRQLDPEEATTFLDGLRGHLGLTS